ncbi:hypothetical protein A1O1_01785 [Capronia coronata CBS 617.96]|uniref:HSF-type DNA-binding domain-containing protein n=1 Tax=Capronia coronata CBS 617.96 TaxID=1182541 RepID=W9YLI0_9EURO|nr:uncharacterized protein A1O1_01785 [Capronia coronata CBS 617.96]EXJ93393.1 hypothetical protein A1O1_01785 [Capronia coronata CBS 617.96]
MAAQGFSRKRPAPGADPVPFVTPMPAPLPGFNDGLGPSLSNEDFFQWGQTGQAGVPYNDANYAMNGGAFPQTMPQPQVQPQIQPQIQPQPQPSMQVQVQPQPSNQLARRPIAQLATHRGRVSEDSTTWNEGLNGIPTATEADWPDDDIAELEARAQIAKREAQAKRKQIPPFVQKLNSFLEDGKNTDLIRWSDDGNSFIVLDEDEFAKTLIPELFKHNNYASFVRQLNMYGFHKKVGLSDNSMRASERKNKSPSEYSNPYFRRGHPDLLWLIQKPKNVTGPSSKRKGKTENDQAEEDVEEYTDDAANNGENRVRPRPGQLMLRNPETSLTQEQFKSVQRELATIRHQQAQISRMMQALKREHEQLYGQAATFQEQHNRHENSINAILTFLATVYNRGIQGHDGMQGIASLFTNAIPVDGASQGNVVDVGDYAFNDGNLDGDLQKPFKKQPLLLTNGNGRQGRASTLSPRSAHSPYPPSQVQPIPNSQQASVTPSVEEVFDTGVNQPTPLSSRKASAQGRDMMSLIQNANARNNATSAGGSPTTPAQDFSNVLNSLESSSGSGPLTTSQRADVLKMINNSTNQPPGKDNALINSTPPSGPVNFHRRLESTQADLEQLAKLQAEQDKSVQNLRNLLQPLSPSGSIPGIGDGQSVPAAPLDIDDFLNNNDYFTDFPSDNMGNYEFGNTGLGPGNNTGTPDDLNFVDYKDDDELFTNLNQNPTVQGGQTNNYDFGMDGTVGGVGGGDQYPNLKYDNGSDYERDGGGRVESVPSSEMTTPRSADDAKVDGPTTRSKGRKLSSVEEDNDHDTGRKRARA